MDIHFSILATGKYLFCLLLASGAAWHLSYFDRFDEDFKLHQRLQQIAKRNHIGLWADKNAIAPWVWRKTE